MATVRRHSIFISYYNILYYYNTTVNGRVYICLDAPGCIIVYVCGVFWFSILGCTIMMIIIINSCCAPDSGCPPLRGLRSSGRRQWAEKTTKTQPQTHRYVGIVRFCSVRERSSERVGKLASVCVSNYYDIFIIF